MCFMHAVGQACMQAGVHVCVLAAFIYHIIAPPHLTSPHLTSPIHPLIHTSILRLDVVHSRCIITLSMQASCCLINQGGLEAYWAGTSI